jgi:hypothetical protein
MPWVPTLNDFEPIKRLGEGGKYTFLLILGKLAVYSLLIKRGPDFLNPSRSMGSTESSSSTYSNSTAALEARKMQLSLRANS